MNPLHLLIIGCGDIGIRVGTALVDAGWSVSALRRHTARLPSSFTAFTGDYTSLAGLDGIRGLDPQYCLFTPTPGDRDVRGYQQGFRDSVDHLRAIGLLGRVRHLFYVSSTRVYAEQTGAVVDEQSPLTTTDPQGVAIVEGEEAARVATSTTVIRPAGIYGAMPGMLIERAAAGRGSADPTRISNRIHREDVAGLLVHLLLAVEAGQQVPGTVNAVDNAPTPIGEVERWLAAQLGVHELSPTAAGSRSPANRHVSNRLLQQLGYVLKYPDWRAGYAPMLASRQDRR